MGPPAFRQFLKSLCSDSHWKYAVFWKIKHQGQSILAWEDGYCDCTRPSKPVETGMECFYQREVISSCCEISIDNSHCEGYSIGLALDDMSCIQYCLGEGPVGRVAYTGQHWWLSLDNLFTGKLNPDTTTEHLNTWFLQFACGIKTILLVPVPQGVLQLGSLQEVAEDPAVVARIKDVFNAVHCAGRFTVPLIPSERVWPPVASSQASCLLEILDESSTFAGNMMKDENFMALDDVKPKLFSANNFGPVPTSKYGSPVFENGLVGIHKSEAENEGDLQQLDLKDLSASLNESADASQLEINEDKLFQLSFPEDGFLAYPHENSIDSGLYDGIINELLEDCNAPDGDRRSSGRIFGFPVDCELHKALGTAFPSQISESLQESSLAVNYGSLSFVDSGDLFDEIDPSWLHGEDENLLEAVVANTFGTPGDTSDKSMNESISTPLKKFALSADQNSHSEASGTTGGDPILQGNVKSAVFSGATENPTSPLTSDSLKSMLSTIVNTDMERGNGYTHDRKGPKSCNGGRKKIRNCNNHRPRPRDRQLIQDRVKELRELVPDGAKCSIDNLLDRTIKHMMYLRSVTERAEKLKQWVHQKVENRKNGRALEAKNGRALEAKNGHQTVARWAFEFGGELGLCPILVEDLEAPGHMLIEMLCDDEGLFLEIAQVIRRLELTILKGEIEHHSYNTWAHFIVEASRGFHRMDIFWPLMHLLQRKRNPISGNV